MLAPNRALIRLQWRSSWRYLAGHPGQLLLATLGLAVGVAAVVSVDIARDTISRSFEDFKSRLNGAASHRIEAAGGNIDTAAYVKLRRYFAEIPMAPVLESRMRAADGNNYRLLGIDALKERRFRDFTGGLLGRGDFDLAGWFGGAGLIVAPTALTADSDGRVTLEIAGRSVRPRLAGSLPASRYPGSRRLLVADISLVQRWLGTDTLSYVDVIADGPQEQALRAGLPTGLRLSAVAGAARERGMSAAFELNLLALSLLALLVGAFIVFNALRFFVVQRRRLYGLMRLMGLDSGHIGAWITLEAVALGLAGTTLGAFLGVLLADTVMTQMAATVNALYYEVGPGQAQTGWATWIKALAVGMLGTLGAVWWPAREAVQAEVLSTLTPWADRSPGMPRRWALGAGLMALVGGALLLAGGLAPALAAVFCLALAYLLAAIPGCWALAGRARSIFPMGRAPVIAFALSRVPHTMNRTGAALAALILAVATVVGVDHMILSFRGSVSDWLAYSLSAGAYVSVTREPQRLPAELAKELAGLPELLEMTAFHTRELDTAQGRITLSAQRLNPRAQESYRFVAGDVERWQDLQRRDVALISEPLARRRSLAPGDRLLLPAVDGERAFEILAVFQDYRSDGGRAVIGLERYREHWRDASLTALGLYFKDSADEGVERQVDAVLAPYADLRFAWTARIRADSLAIFDQTFRLTSGLKWLAAIVAFVGIFGALLALQLERRRESWLLGAIGLSPRRRAQLLLLESGALGLIAGVMALPLGALLAWMLTRVVNQRAFGWTLAVQWLPASFILGVSLALGAALTAAAYPALRTAAGGGNAPEDTY